MPHASIDRFKLREARTGHARATALLFIPVLTLFIYLNIRHGFTQVALAESFVVGMLAAALALLRQGATHLNLAEFLLTLGASIVIFTLVYTGGIARMGMLWLPLLAFAAYFLNGSKTGDRWIVAAALMLVLMLVLSFNGAIHPAYGARELAYALAAFLTMSMLLRFYERVQEGYVAQLQEAGEQLEAALDRALLPEENPDPVMRIAADGKLLDANPAARQLLCPEGENPPEYAPPCAMRHVREALLRNEIIHSEERCGDRWVEWRWAPHRDRGDVSAYGRDITLRIQQESALARFGAALNATDHGILICDEQGGILEVNETAVQTFDALPSRSLADCIPELNMDELRESIAARGRWSTRIEHALNNESRHFEVSAHRFQHRSVCGFVLLVRDATEQWQREEQLHRAQRLESLGVLAGGIAHDFNNLLTAILGNAALAEKKLDADSPARRHLAGIVKASQCAASLCNKMLAYSGKGRFALTRINLSNLARDMVDMFKASINKSVTLQLKLDDEIPPVMAGMAQMQQIMMNLIVNASEAIGDANGVITIATSATRLEPKDMEQLDLFDHLRPGLYVTLEVSDTGCGMNRKTLEHLFEPFFTTKFTGRGLGMSAVLGIVRGHKGAISVRSEEGRGTSIRILLPACEGKRTKTTTSTVGPDGMKGAGVILVADDEEFVRESAAMMLEDCGFEVLTTVDGEQALEIYRKNRARIDLVLLDMMMPRMNGEQAFRELKRLNPNVRVLLSSGYSEQETMHRFSGEGPAGFIQKPYIPEKLCEKCRNAISGQTES